MSICFLVIAGIVNLAFAGPVSYYGEFQTKNYMFVGSKTGSAVQVRGLSLFWSQWGNSFYNANAVNHLASDWKIEVIRAAYGSTGAVYDSETAAQNRAFVNTIIQAAIDNDIYVIVDWHSHNAQKETENSTAFFSDIARTWGQYDNVIFELYNEPTNVEWSGIKSYAETVIDTIRKYSDNLILVGTPNYDQYIGDVIGNAIDKENIGYVLHFYAASHPLDSYKNAILSVLGANLPLFVTEYGTTNADGGCSPVITESCTQDHYTSHSENSSNNWHFFLDSKKISSVAWSVFDKYEGSAFFGTSPDESFDQSNPANWADTNQMTLSGKYIFKKLNVYAESAVWRNPSSILNNSALNADLTGSYETYSLQGKKGKTGAGVYILKYKNGKKLLRAVPNP